MLLEIRFLPGGRPGSGPRGRGGTEGEGRSAPEGPNRGARPCERRPGRGMLAGGVLRPGEGEKMPAQLVALSEGPNILLDKPVLLLGRHPECDIQIDSRKI